MHTFFRKKRKRLKMRRLSAQDLGPGRVELLNLLAPSRDTFASVEYIIDAGPCKQLVKTYAQQTGRRITLTPVMNKLLALAIAENPEFNQMVFSSRVYQMEEIHIANTVLIPGTDTATYIILENPHQKPLESIQQELFAGISNTEPKTDKAQGGFLVALLTGLCYRTGLYRIIGQRRTFTIAFEQGLLSNHTLSNHVYDRPANFFMRKDISPPFYMASKYHLCGAFQEPGPQGEPKEKLHLFVTTDHRVVSGIHSHRFGQSLERISADPANYL